MIFAMKAVMTLATLCYAIGYAARRRDNRLHRRMMLAGFFLSVLVAGSLVAAVMGAGEMPRAAYWIVRAAGTPERAHGVILLHRIIAVVTLVALTAQVITGVRRDPLHGRLFPYAIALWLITYASGMFLLT